MKSLEDFFNVSQLVIPEAPVLDEIPDRMYTDTEVVGYPDQQTQLDIYHWALSGTVPLTGDVSIIDIGAGRGDIVSYIAEMYPMIDLTYTGYELNPLLTKVGNDLLEKLGQDAIIHNEDFLDSKARVADIVLLIGSLNVNHGWNDNYWTYFEKILNKSIEMSRESVIFVLLHDNGGIDQYISYPVPNMVELVLKYKLPFTIDYGKINGVYTLKIDTKHKQLWQAA